jgi:tRNA G46 methylase TrmB
MWPRLQMMKAMLKPGGALTRYIDERELFPSGPMLDELFKEENRLAIINWQKASALKNKNRHVSTATEYDRGRRPQVATAGRRPAAQGRCRLRSQTAADRL